MLEMSLRTVGSADSNSAVMRRLSQPRAMPTSSSSSLDKVFCSALCTTRVPSSAPRTKKDRLFSPKAARCQRPPAPQAAQPAHHAAFAQRVGEAAGGQRMGQCGQRPHRRCPTTPARSAGWLVLEHLHPPEIPSQGTGQRALHLGRRVRQKSLLELERPVAARRGRLAR